MTISPASSSMPPPGRPLRKEERDILGEARVGRLATVDVWNRPAIVPFCFALIGEHDPIVVSVLDEKPKRVSDADLVRVRNIERNSEVAFVIDHYDEDWSVLWFVHVRGQASLLPPGADGHAGSVAALREKYPQYQEMAIEPRPVIVIAGLRATSWHAAGPTALSR